MSKQANPYLFAISHHDLVCARSPDAVIAQRLADAGFDVGLMLWTATPSCYSFGERDRRWREAFARAGIERLEVGEDMSKARDWYRVWRKAEPAPQSLSQVEPQTSTQGPADPAEHQ